MIKLGLLKTLLIFAVCVYCRRTQAGVSAIFVIEVLIGPIGELHHRGKLMFHIERLLAALPDRLEAYGALLNPTHFQLFRASKTWRPDRAQEIQHEDYPALELAHPGKPSGT